MIVFIEGPRHTGKTYLLDAFFKQNKNPNIIYYKFAFARYIDELGMRDQETGPGVHYFSIANVMTILELNRTVFRNKIVIFDRSIFSAYVWSIYRKRMEEDRLLNEFEKILAGDLYYDCVLFYLIRKDMPEPEKREKDYFGNFENYTAEKNIFEKVLSKFNQYTNDSERGNFSLSFTNHFDKKSTDHFCEQLNDLSSVTHLLNK